MGIPFTFGGRIDWLHRSPVLCLLNTYKVTVYLIYGALKSFLCGAAVTYPPNSPYPQRKKKEPKKKERLLISFNSSVWLLVALVITIHVSQNPSRHSNKGRSHNR